MVSTRGGWNTCKQNVLQEISIIVVGSLQQKGTLRVAGPASQGDKPSLLDSALSLGPS